VLVTVLRYGEAKLFELCVNCRGIEPSQATEEGNDVAERSIEVRRSLRHVPNSPTSGQAARADIVPGHVQLTGKLRQSQETADERRLASAIQPQHSNPLSGVNIQVETAQHCDTTVLLR
jgi:hypothetical protein